MTILFAGGGSLGPVTPMLAVAHALKRLAPDAEFAWAGTPNGPEREITGKEGIQFYSIPVAKLPRYPDQRWATFPFDMLQASRAARRIIKQVKPDAVLSVGGFTAVPVIRAAARQEIPCFIHQLDVATTLSNKLVASKCVSKTSSFKREGYELLPTPTRFQAADAPSREAAVSAFGLDATRPVVFVMGGGQGAKALNEAIAKRLDAWLGRTQMIHATGRGKMDDLMPRDGYAVSELLDAEAMRHAYAAADLVITRAGIGALSEIAALSKPSMIVPIPKSHQVENAKAFSAAKAGLFVTQEQVDFDEILFQQAVGLLGDEARCRAMGEAAHAFFPTDDGTALAQRILKRVS
ncbi:glycosyltransferase [Candidatus Uhrbacteria bacterium]|nr:glycosyltransferase [Candidatus Uhrbacteria bacterium]